MTGALDCGNEDVILSPQAVEVPLPSSPLWTFDALGAVSVSRSQKTQLFVILGRFRACRTRPQKVSGRITANMANRCEVCGKAPVVGRTLSHAHNVSARRFEPNLQRVRAKVGGGNRRIYACTRCIRSNKVTKVA